MRGVRRTTLLGSSVAERFGWSKFFLQDDFPHCKIYELFSLSFLRLHEGGNGEQLQGPLLSLLSQGIFSSSSPAGGGSTILLQPLLQKVNYFGN